MKTFRIAMIALVLAFLASNLVYAGECITEPKKVCNIVYAKAMQNPGLVTAMANKLDPGFLGVNQQFYLVEVTYNGVLYRILGSRQQWVSFFWHLRIDKHAIGGNKMIKD